MKNIIFIMIVSLFFIACEDTNSVCVGCSSDIIQLSEDTIEFSASANQRTIATESNSWWVNGISIDDVPQSLGENTDNALDYGDLPNVLKFDFFEIKREDKLILIDVDENTTNSKRIVKVFLSQGNRGSLLTISQAAAIE